MRSPPWNELENRRLARLYFDMLDNSIAGKAYVKAQMIRDAQCVDGCHQELAGRSRASIEFKLMNATAAHLALVPGAELTMDGFGYRAMPNYQAELKTAISNELNERQLRATA